MARRTGRPRGRDLDSGTVYLKIGKRKNVWIGRYTDDSINKEGFLTTAHRTLTLGNEQDFKDAAEAKAYMVKMRKEDMARTRFKFNNGIIYFIQAETTGYIKIGFSSDPRGVRIKHLQVGSPDRLEIIGRLYGNRSTEKQLHNIFEKDWVRGEWFRPSPELLDLVQLLGTTSKKLWVADLVEPMETRKNSGVLVQ